MCLRSYIPDSEKSCYFVRVCSVTETSELLIFSWVTVRREGLAKALKEHLFMCYLYCLPKELYLIFVSQYVFVRPLTSFPVYRSYKAFCLSQILFCNWQLPIRHLNITKLSLLHKRWNKPLENSRA